MNLKLIVNKVTSTLLVVMFVAFWVSPFAMLAIQILNWLGYNITY